MTSPKLKDFIGPLPSMFPLTQFLKHLELLIFNQKSGKPFLSMFKSKECSCLQSNLSKFLSPKTIKSIENIDLSLIGCYHQLHLVEN